MKTGSTLFVVLFVMVAISLLAIWFYPSINDFATSNRVWNGVRNFSGKSGDLRGTFGCYAQSLAKKRMVADLSDRQRAADVGQNQPHRSGDRAARPMDQEAVRRMRIESVDFAFIQVLQPIFERVLDAIYVISKAIPLIETFRCVRRHDLEMTVIGLDE